MLQLDPIGSNWIQLDPIGSNWFVSFKKYTLHIMNASQFLVVLFMSALLFILTSISVNTLSDQLTQPENIKFCILTLIMLIWTNVIFFSDLYMQFYKLKSDLKMYQKQNHKNIMKKYIESSKASCPTTI
jgi:flagellar biosynthesis protein FlhB